MTTSLLTRSPAPEADDELFPPDLPVVRVGLSTWGDRAYRGTIYPPATASGDFLAAYGQVFSTVELSATFYGLPDPARLVQWREAVPPEFRFLPKVSQSITHRDALADAQQGLRAFLERLESLGMQRGPVLLQLSPRFAPHAVAEDRLAAALAILGRQAAVEFRHPDWFHDDATGDPPAARILREYGSTLVITDTVGARGVVHALLTAPALVVRFVATGRPEFDGHRLGEWAQRINDWLGRGLREVYVYIHLDEPTTALGLAVQLRDAINAPARVLGPNPLPESHSAVSPEHPHGQLSLF